MQLFSRKTMLIKVILCVQIIVLTLGTANAQGNRPGPAYSFVYLGDIHFDKRSHHDFEWVKANKPGDIRQIEDYVRITEKYTPGLLRRIQTVIESSDSQIKMIVQGGDLTEGLCGSRELQETQFKDVIECSIISSCCGNSICHSRRSGNPAFSLWTPAFAGVTSSVFVFHNRN